MNALFGVAIATLILYQILIDATFFKIYIVVLGVYHFVTQVLSIDRKHIIKRKSITVTTWDAPSDPHSYVPVDLDCTNALALIKKLNDMQKETKVTLTHIFSKAMMIACYKNRRDIGRIKWGYFQQSKDQGVTILVDYEGGRDLVPVTLWNSHDVSLLDMTRQINEKGRNAK